MCCVIYFRPTWPCIKSGLKPKLWAPLPGRLQPQNASLLYSMQPLLFRLGFWLGFSFPSRNWIIHCNCGEKSFYSDPGPHSCSPPLCWLVLWNRVLERSIDIHVIHICNFRLCVYTFLFVFFDSLAGIAFLARSIKLCLVDNQRSSGVTVAWFESCISFFSFLHLWMALIL